jgi:galactokinase
VSSRFVDLFGSTSGERRALRVATAPGRVNLIGEHTDYNDGWVLPMAIDRRVRVTFAYRDDAVLRVHSTAFDETREVRLDSLTAARGGGWFAYVAGTAWALLDSGCSLRGLDLLVESDLPLGSGLSSSAALEMATARALCAAADLPWQPRAMAIAARKADNEFLGIASGVMDQLVSAAAVPGQALLLDCRSVEWTPAPLPTEARVVVMDTRTPRDLAARGYNERYESCQRAIAAVQSVESDIHSLREVDRALLEAARSRMDATTLRRAAHVVDEIPRPAAMAHALETRDLKRAGQLMNASHASLRELYEVSTPELDAITAAARAHPGCHGARLTGAGFGGCAIALLDASAVDAFLEEVPPVYDAQAETPCSLFATRAAGGAELLE